MNTIKPKHKKRSSAPTKRSRPANNARKRNKPVSTINPADLEKRAVAVSGKKYLSERLFSELPINQALKNKLDRKGFKRPSEIQDLTFETLMARNNLLGIAQTGTGKTAAFLIPIIEQLHQNLRTNYALVLAPTRELAVQIEEELKGFVSDPRLKSCCLIGGTNINTDIKSLGQQKHIVIATPGRLLDLVNRKVIDLRKFNTLVLDEFDRMLDMGFVKDVRHIIKQMNNRKQTLLFSATLDPKQKSLIQSILGKYETVKVGVENTTGEGIDQTTVKVGEGQDKFALLNSIISESAGDKVLIFEETKSRVNRLCKKLNNAGIKSSAIHGNKSQNARQTALNDFKAGHIQVLVATDVASRGIDVTDISLVINYDLPLSMDTYIHRIGRTGRAGKTGRAVTFV